MVDLSPLMPVNPVNITQLLASLSRQNLSPNSIARTGASAYNSGGLSSILKSAGPLGRGLSNILPTGASPAQTASGIGSGIGSAFGSIARNFGKVGQQPQQDPMQLLYQQLIDQLSQPVNTPTGVNTEDLMSQIQKALNPIYDARAQKAQGQSDRARGEVKDMYRALSNDYERLAPLQKQQAAAAQEEIKQLYGQLRSNIQGDYTRVSNEQGELFKQLGIEDALPNVLDEQNDMVTNSLTSAAENQAQQEQRYMDIGNMDQTYYTEGSPLATMRGNEISTDLLAQLTDYLNQNESERVSGIQSSYMDQLGQANSQLAQQQQIAQSEAARRQEMLWQILQSSMQGNQQEMTPDTYLSQLNPSDQQSLAQAFTSLQRSPESIYGKTRDPRNPSAPFVETTPEWYLSQADEMLRRGEISPTTHQQLLMYIQMYYGMGQ